MLIGFSNISSLSIPTKQKHQSKNINSVAIKTITVTITSLENMKFNYIFSLRIQGDDLASTWVTKLVGACRGRNSPRKSQFQSYSCKRQ